MPTTSGVRGHADTALPRVVSAEGWREAREELLVAEKALTRAGDAVAAQRRRMPMTEVDATLEAAGSDGLTSLLDMFEGRRQLIVYHHMLKPDDDHPCAGCSAFIDHVPHLAHFKCTMRRSRWRRPHRSTSSRHIWTDGQTGHPIYSSGDGRFRDQPHPSPDGTGSFGLSVFLRDGTRVYRTYATQGRGVDGVQLIDLTPYGRQETFEDSPVGWPQRKTYTFGKVHDEYSADELAGLAAPSTTGEVYRDD